jgi:O-antigen/teichoic acid export membrane protein
MSLAGRFEALGRRLGLSGSGIRTAALVGARLWATNGFVALVGFVTPLAFARLSTPEEYGRFSYVAAMVALCNIGTLPGLNISLRQAAARGYHGTLTRTAAARMRWSAGVAALMAAAGIWMLFAGDPVTARTVLWVAPVLPFLYGIDVAQVFLNGTEHYRAMSSWMLATAAAPAAAVALTLTSGASGAAAIVSYFYATAVLNVLSFAAVLTRHRRNDLVDAASLAYGRRLTLITTLGALQSYSDKLLLGTFLRLHALALYSVGKLFQQALTIAWGALHQLYAPKLASRDVDRARHLTRSTLPYVWAIFGMLALAAVAGAPAIVATVFGPEYADSVPAARILAIGLFATIPGAQFEILFTSTGDARRLFAQRIAFASTHLVLVAGGTVLFGLMGAVWATAIAYTLNSAFGFLLDRRR